MIDWFYGKFTGLVPQWVGIILMLSVTFPEFEVILLVIAYFYCWIYGWPYFDYNII